MWVCRACWNGTSEKLSRSIIRYKVAWKLLHFFRLRIFILSHNCCYLLSTVALVGCFVWGRCTYMFSLKVRWKVLKSRGTGLRNIPRSFDVTGFAYDSTKIGGRCPPVPLCPTGLHSFRRGGGAESSLLHTADSALQTADQTFSYTSC